jgi:hypothetical protein
VGGAPPSCEDDNPCTDDSCDVAQGCVYASNNSCNNQPKRKRFWKKVYNGKVLGERLTQADVDCVKNSCMFGSLSTVADIYDRLIPDSDDACQRAQAQLMALVLNVCRGRVSESRSVHARCSTLPTVGDVMIEAEQLLCSPSHTEAQCRQAKCETAYINKGGP